MSRIGICTAIAIAIGAVSCGGIDNAAGDHPGGATESTVLFGDANTSGPRLEVLDFNGDVAVSVSGPIGTETATLAGLRPDATLVDIYRHLHPGAFVPSELVALDQRIAPSLNGIVSSPSLAEPPPQPVVVDKTSLDFGRIVCQTFVVDRSISYVPVNCVWAINDTVLPDGATSLRGYTIPANDRAYGWNNKSTPAQIRWYLNGGSTLAGVTNLPAFYWNWSSVLSGGPYQVKIVSDNAGEMGFTHHALSIVVK